MYPYAKNCIKYIVCEGGIPHVYSCDWGYFYSPSFGECDHPGRVDCGDRPVCDENDENCEDWDITTKDPIETTKLPWCNPMNILCGYGQYYFEPEGDSKLT